ncbi:MAG: hypothetical protein S4CHLAM7_07190 [Chlamydiae bacterium]|nr:hypothetical protein [Chlamydiota bacterium]
MINIKKKIVFTFFLSTFLLKPLTLIYAETFVWDPPQFSIDSTWEASTSWSVNGLPSGNYPNSTTDIAEFNTSSGDVGFIRLLTNPTVNQIQVNTSSLIGFENASGSFSNTEITLSGTNPGIYFNSTDSTNPKFTTPSTLNLASSASFINQSSTGGTPNYSFENTLKGTFAELNFGDGANPLFTNFGILGYENNEPSLTINNTPNSTLIIGSTQQVENATLINNGTAQLEILTFSAPVNSPNKILNNGELFVIGTSAATFEQTSTGTLTTYIGQNWSPSGYNRENGSLQTLPHQTVSSDVYGPQIGPGFDTNPKMSLTLAGNLNLQFLQGAYKAQGDLVLFTPTYTASGSFNSFVGPFADKVGDFKLDSTFSYIFSITSSFVVLPGPLSSYTGTVGSVVNHIFGADGMTYPDSSTLSSDEVVHLTALNQTGFIQAMQKMSGSQTQSFNKVHTSTKFKVGNTANKKFYRAHRNYIAKERNLDYPTFGIPLTGLYVEPIGVYHKQQAQKINCCNTEAGFDSYTYGATVGGIKVIKEQFVFEGNFAYTRTNFFWLDGEGKANWDKLYLAPFIGWFNQKAYANFMVMGSVAFHKNYRHVNLSSKNIAESDYNSYGLLLRANGGARVYFGKGFWFQPDGTLNYITTFTDGYKEYGGGNTNLVVANQVNYFMQPSFRAKFIQEYYTKKFCYAPSLYLGVLTDIPLGDNNGKSRLASAPTSQMFTIVSPNQTSWQMIVGADLYMQRFEKFILNTTFEANLFSKQSVFELKSRFEWLF